MYRLNVYFDEYCKYLKKNYLLDCILTKACDNFVERLKVVRAVIKWYWVFLMETAPRQVKFMTFRFSHFNSLLSFEFKLKKKIFQDIQCTLW